ncbi:MAG: hypothetical protein GX616_07405 [Planctomycetes bacterium]|nr:hypothetical protein [Planctomycetota bacterium]
MENLRNFVEVAVVQTQLPARKPGKGRPFDHEKCIENPAEFMVLRGDYQLGAGGERRVCQVKRKHC